MNEKHLRLPKQWPQQVRQSVVQAVSLAFCAVTHSRGWAINSPIERVRLRSDLERAVNEIALLRNEIRIKDARMNKVPAPRRPHYSPTERMSILELRAARGWSAAQTARVFLVEAETVSSWARCAAESGGQTLVRLPSPVNKFPDFVSYLVQRLKTLCPTLGRNASRTSSLTPAYNSGRQPSAGSSRPHQYHPCLPNPRSPKSRSNRAP